MIIVRILLKHLRCYEKHRRVQLYVTIGTLVAGVIAIFHPEYAHAGALAGIATNLIWVWE